ncbi:MAG TPA: sigma-54 dependent transcriptional regulator [Bryobacteraceae bacterium]|nr:sigma-54 dependent transcriptional regulator [Bryobacteraceae bacterium]
MSSAFQIARSPGKILLADDEPEIRGYLEMALRCRGYSVESVPDGEEALERLQREDKFSLVLLDVLMPRKNGLEALRHIRQLGRRLPVIMLSCASSAVTVVEAMKSGATDFLSKPISHEDLGSAVEKALSESASPAFALEAVRPKDASSLPFLSVKSLEPILMKIGASTVPVLIQGETGVGKEVIAKRLHTQSIRADKPFWKLNCAALPPELVESELFGYERGAFTGAFQRKPGMFELADGGTILLDEIGDMELRLQAKLLQVLQDQEFQRVGGRQAVRVDVRVIAATHCDLEQAIADKRFRADLYYRLNVVSLLIPALRDRKDEIIPLAEFLVRRHGQTDPLPWLPPDLRRALTEYAWPGNVRELDNLIRRWLVLQESGPIIDYLKRNGDDVQPDGHAPLEPLLASPSPKVPRDSASRLHKVREANRDAETEVIIAALNAARWNRKKAAASLRVDYKALLYKMKKLGISDQVVL